MGAATFPLAAEQGATLRQTVTVNTTAKDSNGNAIPQDLTGCTAEMMIRQRYGAPSALLTLTDADGGIVLGGAAGTIEIVLTAAQTLGLPVNLAGLNGAQLAGANGPPLQAYVYDLDVTYPSGDVNRIVQGPFTVAATVTR